jgi:hypothetical protein
VAGRRRPDHAAGGALLTGRLAGTQAQLGRFFLNSVMHNSGRLSWRPFLLGRGYRCARAPSCADADGQAHDLRFIPLGGPVPWVLATFTGRRRCSLGGRSLAGCETACSAQCSGRLPPPRRGGGERGSLRAALFVASSRIVAQLGRTTASGGLPWDSFQGCSGRHRSTREAQVSGDGWAE